MKVETYDGQELEISGQDLEEYLAWQKDYLRQVGQDLAAKWPKLYGRIEFNVQGGKFVNGNIVQGFR